MPYEPCIACLGGILCIFTLQFRCYFFCNRSFYLFMHFPPVFCSEFHVLSSITHCIRAKLRLTNHCCQKIVENLPYLIGGTVERTLSEVRLLWCLSRLMTLLASTAIKTSLKPSNIHNVIHQMKLSFHMKIKGGRFAQTDNSPANVRNTQLPTTENCETMEKEACYSKITFSFSTGMKPG